LILADTSVWIDHFRYGNPTLRHQLERNSITIHPFIIAELALGSLKTRARALALLDQLPQIGMATAAEVRATIEARHLYNRGIGLTDAHLIASVFLHPATELWTNDKPLRKVAEELDIHWALA
jgi:predicted nucleic acid-binding protein